MAVDERRQRIRRNMARAWAYAAAAYAASATASVAYNPAVVFGSGTYKGFWVDPTVLSSLKQSSDGSVAVAADADPVGYVTEQSGAGGVLNQTVNASRPTYKVVGGYPCLRFDGTDDHILGDATVRAVTDSAPAFSFVFVANSDSTLAAAGHVLRTQATVGQEVFNIYQMTATNLRMASVAGNFDTSVASDTVVVYSIRYEPAFVGTNVFVRRNKTLLNSGTLGPITVNSGVGGRVALSDTAFSNAFKGDIYQALLVNRLLSDADVASVEIALGAKAGITL
jgi:hypothetical protein